MLPQSLRLGGHARATSRLFPSFCGSGQLVSLFSSAASGDDKFVVVRRDSAKVVRSGNPIIFDGSIERSTLRKEGLKSGDFVRILDEKKNCLAKGFYNRTSMYSVRVLVTEGSNLMNIDCWETILKERILTAVRRRIELCLAKATDCYRLVNGEGDMLSGLIVDQVGESCIIIQSSAYWTEKHRGLIINIFNELFNNESGSADQKVKIIFTTHANRVRQDGFTGPCPELQEEERAVLHDKVITENGLKFKVFSSTNPAFTTIQKTGFYCDQRENRLLVRSLSRGKSVLDLYCYSGGFSLNAWVGGASEVIGVDSSEPAVELAKDNVLLNRGDNMDPSLISFVREDAVAFLSRLVQENAERIRNNQPAKYFDLIICDPPKLAPSRQSITPAVKKYVEINSLAMALLDPVNGGYLCTFSCSAHITQRQILSDIMKSAASAPLKQVGDLPTRHRHVDILKTLYPGMDHPLNIEFLDGAYLSGYLVHVS